MSIRRNPKLNLRTTSVRKLEWNKKNVHVNRIEHVHFGRFSFYSVTTAIDTRVITWKIYICNIKRSICYNPLTNIYYLTVSLPSASLITYIGIGDRPICPRSSAVVRIDPYYSRTIWTFELLLLYKAYFLSDPILKVFRRTGNANRSSANARYCQYTATALTRVLFIAARRCTSCELFVR